MGASADFSKNVSKLMEAWLDAGSFVHVKDVATPVSQARFGTAELAEARRWVELNRAVNRDLPNHAA